MTESQEPVNDQIDNIINPDDSIANLSDPSPLVDVLDDYHLKGSEVPTIDGFENHSVDNLGILTESIGHDDNDVLTAFSPILPNNSLLSNKNLEHITHRNSSVGIYHSQQQLLSNNGNSSSNTNMIPLLSESLLSHNKASPKLLKHGNGLKSKRKLHSAKTRPAFVNKLWNMVNDMRNKDLIHWNKDGTTFIVTHRENFVHEILPKYFRHSNFASFVRQLNMYGWHKVQDIRSGSIQNNSDERWEFENKNFIQNKEEFLENIIRQKPSSSQVHKDAISLMANGEEIDIGILINELETVKYNQMAIAEDLKRISKDNELLWQENILARERHQTQQQALEKIMKFLSSLYGSNTTKLLGNDLFHDFSDSTNLNLQVMSPIYTNICDDSIAEETRIETLDGNFGQSRPRLLLKNRAPSLSSDKPRDSPIQEINGSSDRIHELSNDLAITQKDTNTQDGNKILHDLQHNIDRQGESIQEIQDWINQLGPNESPASNRFDVQEYLSSSEISSTLSNNCTVTPFFHNDIHNHPSIQEISQNPNKHERSEVESMNIPPSKRRK